VDFAEWVDQVNPEYLGADPEFLRCVHELGMSSLVWTVDEAAGMERAIDAGADGIITNAPDRLVEIVETLCISCQDPRVSGRSSSPAGHSRCLPSHSRDTCPTARAGSARLLARGPGDVAQVGLPVRGVGDGEATAGDLLGEDADEMVLR